VLPFISATGPRVVTEQAREPLRRMESFVVGIEAIMEHREFLPALLFSDVCDRVLVTKPLKVLLQQKWLFLFPYWAAECAVYLCLLIAYLIFAATFGDVRREGLCRAAGLVSVLLCAVFFLRECIQLRSQLQLRLRGTFKPVRFEYFSDPFNAIDIATLVCIPTTVLSARSVEIEDITNSVNPHWIQYLTGVTVLLAMVKQINFLRALESTGFLITMLVRIVCNLRHFLAIMILIIAAFAMSFYVILRHVSVEEGSENIYGALGYEETEHAFWAVSNLALLGDFDTAIYATNPVTIGMFHLVTLVTVVVMLNVLIAIISDDFENVLSRKEEEALRQRAATIIDLEGVYLRPYFAEDNARGRAFTRIDYQPVIQRHWHWHIQPVEHTQTHGKEVEAVKLARRQGPAPKLNKIGIVQSRADTTEEDCGGAGGGLPIGSSYLLAMFPISAPEEEMGGWVGRTKLFQKQLDEATGNILGVVQASADSMDERLDQIARGARK
jgi:hypothetical protein